MSIIDIYVFDTRLDTPSPLRTPVRRALRGITGYEVTIPVTHEWSIHRVVSRIRQHAPPSSLRYLMLNSHGGPGFMELGTGLTPATAHHFFMLRGCFRSDGIITLKGCAIASGHMPGSLEEPGSRPAWGGGQQLATIIAEMAGVPVRAPANLQRISALDLEGAIYTAYPPGHRLTAD